MADQGSRDAALAAAGVVTFCLLALGVAAGVVQWNQYTEKPEISITKEPVGESPPLVKGKAETTDQSPEDQDDATADDDDDDLSADDDDDDKKPAPAAPDDDDDDAPGDFD